MWDEALTTVTPEIWKNCIRHTEDEIPKWYAREHLFDRQEILPIVINVDDDDDTEAANLFIKNKNLEGKGYNVFIPLNFTTSKGLVREIDLDFSETELLESCSCKSDIINIKRLNRKIFRNDKIEYLPAGTCLFTFKGTIMPKEIEFFRLPLPVSMYIPSVTQCFSCLLYGHTKKNCKGQKNCFNCGEKNAQSHKIMITGEDKPAYTCDTKCHFCHEPHKSSYKKMSRIHEITRY
ncbi:hypothetical protein HUJ05_009852 [Dendroctonus ponderosae]|nr:hypothetical protein HUJ05_009852 [Dendroctonus ponderosae]